jgi:sarcosine oxidase subunit gamma
MSLRSRDVVFDIPINRCTETNGLTIARLGPDEWLLLGADAASGTIEQGLNEALAGRVHSLVDISHRQVAIEVSGLRAREVLNGGCPLDLADEAFPAGSATRTLFGKAEIVLIRSGAAATFRVECWRSFAPYVYGLLTEIASEFAQA